MNERSPGLLEDEEEELPIIHIKKTADLLDFWANINFKVNAVDAKLKKKRKWLKLIQSQVETSKLKDNFFTCLCKRYKYHSCSLKEREKKNSTKICAYPFYSSIF